MENTEKTKPETTKIEGIAAQINLSPGSETHKRFAQLMKENGATTTRGFIEVLLDVYEKSATIADNSATIAELKDRLTSVIAEKDALNNTCQSQEAEISELKERLEEANNQANANAENGLGKQLQLDELQKQMEGAIIVKPNPVSLYFLKEMAEKTKTEPGKILEKLFFDDLQNPRANNLPYTVTASRIREVLNELKPKEQ